MVKNLLVRRLIHSMYINMDWTQAANLRASDVLVLSNGEFVTVEWVQF